MNQITDLNDMTVVELRNLAQSLNLAGFSRLRKTDLVEFIRQHQAALMAPEVSADVESNIEPYGVNLAMVDSPEFTESTASKGSVSPVDSDPVSAAGADRATAERSSDVNVLTTPLATSVLPNAEVQQTKSVPLVDGSPDVITIQPKTKARQEIYIDRGPELPSLAARPVTRAMVVDPMRTHLYWQPPQGTNVQAWKVVAEKVSEQPGSFRVPGFGNEGEVFAPVSELRHIQVSADTGVQAVIESAQNANGSKPAHSSSQRTTSEQWVDMREPNLAASGLADVESPVSGTTTWESLYPQWKIAGGASDLLSGSRP